MTIRAVCFQVNTCSDARADAGDAGGSDDDDDDDERVGGRGLEALPCRCAAGLRPLPIA